MNTNALKRRLRLLYTQFGGTPSPRRVDNVDAMTTMSGGEDGQGGHVPMPAPTNWVPSMQDEKPRH
jgi:hypothetical protein